jgi:type IV secretory pathway component VirB8
MRRWSLLGVVVYVLMIAVVAFIELTPLQEFNPYECKLKQQRVEASSGDATGCGVLESDIR